VLLVNPGGPGVPARFLVEDAFAFTGDLQAHFDIVALDPRGTFPEVCSQLRSGYLWSGVSPCSTPDERLLCITGPESVYIWVYTVV
jgi:hypothetical protein